MTVVTESQPFQVVIPAEIRESMGVVAGQKVQIVIFQNGIETIPLKPIAETLGQR